VDAKTFLNAIPMLKTKLDGRAILRAWHYFEENIRAQNAKKAIELSDKSQFLDIINASGDSSYKLLQNCYPMGDTEQNIPLALALSKSCANVKACRVHGGGFAGTILAIVDKENCAAFEKYIASVFGKENVFTVAIREFGAIEVEI